MSFMLRYYQNGYRLSDMANQIDVYNKNFVDNGFERLGLFELLRDEYDIESAIYLGSYVHITPAFVFQRTAFIDSDRRVQKFFGTPEVLDFVKQNKQYAGEPQILASQQNYEQPIPKQEPYDLLISQYAGFVSQAGTKFLKRGGILVANSSHGDASMAHLDDDYEFIGVANRSKGRWRIGNKSLSDYFVPKKGPHPSKTEIQASMKGVGYTKSAANYVFKKVKR